MRSLGLLREESSYVLCFGLVQLARTLCKTFYSKTGKYCCFTCFWVLLDIPSLSYRYGCITSLIGDHKNDIGKSKRGFWGDLKQTSMMYALYTPKGSESGWDTSMQWVRVPVLASWRPLALAVSCTHGRCARRRGHRPPPAFVRDTWRHGAKRGAGLRSGNEWPADRRRCNVVV